MSLRFEPMSDADFQAYLRKAVPEYANAQAQSGNWHPDEAAQRAYQEYQRVLPNGPHTPGQFLCVLVDAEKNERVGMLWYTLDDTSLKKKAFLADFFLFSEARHQGYEAQALAFLERQLAAQGVARIEVQLFAHDRDECSMYEQAGFAVASLFLGKDIPKREHP